jgi:hypothetical protein
MMAYFNDMTKAIEMYNKLPSRRGRVRSSLLNSYQYSVECEKHKGVYIPVYITLDGQYLSILDAIDKAFDSCEPCAMARDDVARWKQSRWPAGAEL